MAFAVGPAIIKFGIPLGMRGLEFLAELYKNARNKPDMTQEEFETQIWLPMQARYKPQSEGWDDAVAERNAGGRQT